ncbi:SRPBCC family protein [Egicoccus halophilus]|uniref:SRPBCC family protein n=1 Tax=Egicoccus halophilus TaxID=1670830 RepID=UPI0010323833|nr:SRPBCC family protein [Egicoccus halophilus]
MDVKERLGITKRQRVLGLPFGPKRTDWSRVAKLGAGAAAATELVRRGLGGSDDESSQNGSGSNGSGGGLLEKGKQKAGELIEESPVGQLAEQGKEAASTVTDIGGKVSDASEAASGASTGVGKAFQAAKSLGSDDDDGDDGGGGGGDGDGTQKKQRLIIQEHVDVAVPRSSVYNQWTQFEDFPTFSRATEQVDQEEEETTEWQAKILFSRRNWKAEIKEQIPDKRIVWESSGDVQHRGVVTFHELDEELTRIQVEMEYEPSGFVEKFGNLFLTVRHRVRKDLRLFKHWLEFESEESGAWRGRIDDGEVVEDGEEDEQASSESDDQATAESDDQATAESDDQTGDESDDQTTAESDDQTGDESDDQATAESDDQTGDESDDQATAESDDQTGDESDDQATAESDDQTGDESDDEMSAESDDEMSAESDDEMSAESDDEMSAESDDDPNADPEQEDPNADAGEEDPNAESDDEGEDDTDEQA